MTQRNQSRLSQILEYTALDWLPIVFNVNAFPESPKPTSARRNEIKTQIADLQDEPLEELVVNFRDLLEQEEKRRNQIEVKATYLLGFTAVALSFIVGFAQFLLGQEILSQPLRWITVSLYVLIASSLIMTVVLARQAVAIRTFRTPMPSDLLKLRKSNRNYFFHGLAAELLESYEYNHAVVNDKITYVRGAEDWFRNTLVFLLTLTMVMSIGIVVTSEQGDQEQNQPVQMIILTPTPTDSPTPTPTATITPTQTPTATHTPGPPTIVVTPANPGP